MLVGIIQPHHHSSFYNHVRDFEDENMPLTKASIEEIFSDESSFYGQSTYAEFPLF